MKRFDENPLSFPIGANEYVIPPVGIDAGWELTELLSMDETQLAKQKIKTDDLFRLALSPGVWDQMRADGADMHLSFRAGMAALAHFRILASGGSNDAAQLAADAVWESGIDPEALAAWMAAKQQPNPAGSTTSPRTGKAGSSTKRPASTSGTTSRTSRSSGKASNGRTSPRRGT